MSVSKARLEPLLHLATMSDPFDIRVVFRVFDERNLAVYVGYNDSGKHGYFIVDEGENREDMKILEFCEKTSEDTYQTIVKRLLYVKTDQNE